MRALGEPMDPLDPLMDPFAVVETTTTTPAPTPHNVRARQRVGRFVRVASVSTVLSAASHRFRR